MSTYPALFCPQLRMIRRRSCRKYAMMNPSRLAIVFAAIGVCVLQMLQETSSKDCGQPLLDEPVEVMVVEGENLLLNITLQGRSFESETQFLWRNKTRRLLAKKSCKESSNSIVLKCGRDSYRSLHHAVIDIPAVHAEMLILFKYLRY